MLLNQLEFALMNNPIRAWVQRRIEARRLLRMGGRIENGLALEVGCGQGRGVEIIFDLFGAAAVDAFDLDVRMILRAGNRLKHRRSVRLWTADCAALPLESGRYDAVFDFGIIHHVPDWQQALAEIARVLKPGGRFYAEEVLGPFLLNPTMRRLFRHPETNRFTQRDFAEELRKAGFEVTAQEEFRNSFAWFTATRRAGGRGATRS